MDLLDRPVGVPTIPNVTVGAEGSRLRRFIAALYGVIYLIGLLYIKAKQAVMQPAPHILNAPRHFQVHRMLLRTTSPVLVGFAGL